MWFRRIYRFCALINEPLDERCTVACHPLYWWFIVLMERMFCNIRTQCSCRMRHPEMRRSKHNHTWSAQTNSWDGYHLGAPSPHHLHNVTITTTPRFKILNLEMSILQLSTLITSFRRQHPRTSSITDFSKNQLTKDGQAAWIASIRITTPPPSSTRCEISHPDTHLIANHNVGTLSALLRNNRLKHG